MRKLLPDSWGFMCPVHTPDGSPCGLLLHLTAACRVATAPPGEPDSVQAAIAMVRAARSVPSMWRILHGACLSGASHAPAAACCGCAGFVATCQQGADC